MSCNACTRRYGFFCKETGCPNCGYSFCTKCLKKMIQVPRCNNEKLKVCPKCYEKLEKEKYSHNSNKVQQNKFEANEVFAINEPIENLTPPLEPISPTREDTPDDNELVDNLDNMIVKKLENLKKDNDDKEETFFPSDTDIAGRIAALKGVPYKEYTKADISLLGGPSKTDQEQINDLIKQFIEEKHIDDDVKDNQIDPIKDIERRLAILKGDDINSKLNKTNIPVEKEEDEETEIKKVMEKFIEEAKLPDFTDEEKEYFENLPKPTKNTEELPWCTICNEDAVIRCIGCDGDLFCKRCFRECHDDEEYREHRTESYSKDPNFKENHF